MLMTHQPVGIKPFINIEGCESGWPVNYRQLTAPPPHPIITSAAMYTGLFFVVVDSTTLILSVWLFIIHLL